ncbi:unnamed protein product [Rotaria sordida]|uniref:Spondin domain-containing protein n=1 Tax=Rotaria sordida TaxID=392033 RepID=A0A819P2E9_9BILA|nr:unnamed protein product [Rotaria sordida]CAF4006915.1 unnamed protein product [Rotaria sordida]
MWSEWSSYMDAICHRPGTQIRTRTYADKRAAMAAHCTEHLEQQQQCTLEYIPKAVHRPSYPCCACDEAKFQFTFQGLWSKQSYPKDWLPEHLHWFDIIGAVHNEEYSCNDIYIYLETNSYSRVSVLDLCLPNCTWLDNYEELHHPIDAGTDIGIQYDGPKRPENSHKPIAPIVSSNITDNRSSFYGNQPPPFAKLNIKRIMVQDVAYNDLSCPMATWSECSVTCGRNGIRRRTRTLLSNHRAVDQHRCQSLPLEETQPCYLNLCRM